MIIFLTFLESPENSRETISFHPDAYKKYSDGVHFRWVPLTSNNEDVQLTLYGYDFENDR